MEFAFFILLNAILFIRPAEIVPDLLGLPLYEIGLALCLLTSGSKVLAQLRIENLRENPITACVVGLFFAIVLSHLSHMNTWGVRNSADIFYKVALYYLLLVSILDSPQRLRSFLLWLVCFVFVLATIAVLQYHGYIDVPSLTTLEDRVLDPETGQLIVLPRLRSTGIYNDPNDLGMILVCGTLLSIYALTDRAGPMTRVVFLGPLALFLYSLALTQSRGAFLSLLVGVLTLFQMRYGWKKTIFLAGLGIPLLFALFSGRQTELSTSAGTGQTRIQLWSEGLVMLREAPIFGIGHTLYADRAGLVAHNSFVHCFAELGMIGGSLFLGAFCFAGITHFRLNQNRELNFDSKLRDMSPFITAVVLAYVVGLFSLSRSYVIPTYSILGMASVYLRLSSYSSPVVLPNFDGAFVRRLGLQSMVFVPSLYVFVKVFISRG